MSGIGPRAARSPGRRILLRPSGESSFTAPSSRILDATNAHARRGFRARRRRAPPSARRATTGRAGAVARVRSLHAAALRRKGFERVCRCAAARRDDQTPPRCAGLPRASKAHAAQRDSADFDVSSRSPEPQEAGEADPAPKPQARMRARTGGRDGAAGRLAPDLLRSIDGPVQQNRSRTDVRGARGIRPTTIFGEKRGRLHALEMADNKPK